MALTKDYGFFTFPHRRYANLPKLVQIRCNRRKMISRQYACLGGKLHTAVRNQYFSFTYTFRIQQYLTRCRIGCSVFRPDVIVLVTQRYPHSLTTPSDMHNMAVKRHRLAKGLAAMRGFIFFETGIEFKAINFYVHLDHPNE